MCARRSVRHTHHWCRRRRLGDYTVRGSVVLENKVSQWRKLYSCCPLLTNAGNAAELPIWMKNGSRVMGHHVEATLGALVPGPWEYVALRWLVTFSS